MAFPGATVLYYFGLVSRARRRGLVTIVQRPGTIWLLCVSVGRVWLFAWCVAFFVLRIRPLGVGMGRSCVSTVGSPS